MVIVKFQILTFIVKLEYQMYQFNIRFISLFLTYNISYRLNWLYFEE